MPLSWILMAKFGLPAPFPFCHLIIFSSEYNDCEYIARQAFSYVLPVSSIFCTNHYIQNERCYHNQDNLDVIPRLDYRINIFY